MVDVAQDGDQRLDQTEVGLGEHVTGGVVQSWRQVQRKLQDVQSECKLPTLEWQMDPARIVSLYVLPNQLLRNCNNLIMYAGQTTAGTDHDKLLAQLETELQETQQLVRLQQQLLQV